MKEVAVYKGENIECIGTINEVAHKLGVKPYTIRFYLTPTYKKRLKQRKREYRPGRRILVKI